MTSCMVIFSLLRRIHSSICAVSLWTISWIVVVTSVLLWVLFNWILCRLLGVRAAVTMKWTKFSVSVKKLNNIFNSRWHTAVVWSALMLRWRRWHRTMRRNASVSRIWATLVSSALRWTSGMTRMSWMLESTALWIGTARLSLSKIRWLTCRQVKGSRWTALIATTTSTWKSSTGESCATSSWTMESTTATSTAVMRRNWRHRLLLRWAAIRCRWGVVSRIARHHLHIVAACHLCCWCWSGLFGWCLTLFAADDWHRRRWWSIVRLILTLIKESILWSAVLIESPATAASRSEVSSGPHAHSTAVWGSLEVEI